MKRFFGDNFFVRGDLKAIRVTGVSNTDLAFNLGVGYAFGAKPSRAVAAAPTPTPQPAAPVQETDSDGDGVPDSRDRCANTPRELAVDANGCPILETHQVSQDLLVNFDFDRADIKPEFDNQIAEFGQFMSTYSNTRAVIEGHTDNTGPAEYNQGLSERRAQAVMNRLVEAHDVPASRLSAVGHGESRPLVSNDTQQNRARNRRIMAEVTAEVEEQVRR
ncbi:MAG TPA: OmpA family protein [Pseudomonadaceae bacterium]|nr:OmpA family protein [Pseudomonadaceae bacterium]